MSCTQASSGRRECTAGVPGRTPDLPHATLHRAWHPAYGGALPLGRGAMLVYVGLNGFIAHSDSSRPAGPSATVPRLRGVQVKLCVSPEPEAASTGCGGSPAAGGQQPGCARFGMSMCSMYEYNAGRRKTEPAAGRTLFSVRV